MAPWATLMEQISVTAILKASLFKVLMNFRVFLFLRPYLLII